MTASRIYLSLINFIRFNYFFISCTRRNMYRHIHPRASRFRNSIVVTEIALRRQNFTKIRWHILEFANHAISAFDRSRALKIANASRQLSVNIVRARILWCLYDLGDSCWGQNKCSLPSFWPSHGANICRQTLGQWRTTRPRIRRTRKLKCYEGDSRRVPWRNVLPSARFTVDSKSRRPRRCRTVCPLNATVCNE